MKHLIIAAFLSCCLPLAHAVSFDCTKAATFVEKEICNDPILGKLDDALGANYKQMLSSNIGSGAAKDLKATQKAWLTIRNKCSTKQCVVDAYRKRVDDICDYPVISGVHPNCTSSDDIK
jgi:uncharacterized protein